MSNQEELTQYPVESHGCQKSVPPIRATPEGIALLELLSRSDLIDIRIFKNDIDILCAKRFGLVK